MVTGCKIVYPLQADERGTMSKYNWYVLTKNQQVACEDCVDGRVVLITAQTQPAPRDVYVGFRQRVTGDDYMNENLEVVRSGCPSS